MHDVGRHIHNLFGGSTRATHACCHASEKRKCCLRKNHNNKNSHNIIRSVFFNSLFAFISVFRCYHYCLSSSFSWWYLITQIKYTFKSSVFILFMAHTVRQLCVQHMTRSVCCSTHWLRTEVRDRVMTEMHWKENDRDGGDLSIHQAALGNHASFSSILFFECCALYIYILVYPNSASWPN